ncbi:hypothetical protein FOZ63_026701 [Perkinsus olseni]|uniref:GC-rich sequence DNA-binding factor n=1 Tax=Perkinsus olseni TaxID=32597 RepID=A0A7J6QIP6_PEROL|nr:hypothetical protein FOZ62_031056 [Perkinsus olseni]KAF4708600.1 hypothetical protein FOZ63_026701 [Perkinsus olseni]
MQTFIIWIPSVICLMIHIPQVYGAAPFNSDNDEDPMEADDGPYGGLGKRRRNPNTRPLLKAVMNQQHKRRSTDQGMPISIAPSFKRKRESMDEDTLQANKRVANTEGGECKAETEHVISGESRAKLCKIENNGDPQLAYGDDDRRFSSLGLACGQVEYYIDGYGISGVDIDDEYYFVAIPDPLKDIHQKAFQMTECSEVFKLLQSELMKRVPRDSISGELCDAMKTEMCRTYKNAASEIIPRLLTISEEASMEMI